MILGFALAGLFSCGEEAGRGAPEPVLWPRPEVVLPAADYFTERPWLLDLSTWAAPGCGVRQPREARWMGDFGVGNGHVFALCGYACPLNTLHTMVGPDYQQESEFFHDTWVRLDPAPAACDAGWMHRVRRTAVLVGTERFGAIELATVTFAPAGTGPADPVRRALVRVVVVHNLGDTPSAPLALVTEQGDETRAGRTRRLVVLAPAGAAVPARVELGSLGPSEEKTAVFAYVTSVGGAGEQATIEALRAAGADALAETTRDWWFSFSDRAATLDAPDPRVDDLIEGMRVTIRAQQTYLGGVSPMSRYTLMWIRDTAGAVRFFLRSGLFDQARAMLDYYHLAATVRGDISNALALDLDPDEPPVAPDWRSMPPFEGRCEGETPSYLPLMARWYTRATGDDTLVDEQYDFLWRAVSAQNVSEAGLLPFSGDETYRGAMSMTLGWDIEHDYAGCCKSANSSFLFAAAAEALAIEADLRGHTDDARTLRQRADLVREAADAHYWTGEGWWAPFVQADDPDTLPPPFEDVATKPLWTGFAGPDDPRTRQNLESVLALLGREDGFLQSPLHERYVNYMDFEVEQGVYTGMMPGYFLYNLALCDHPLAERAFNALELAASPSGNFAEYQVYDDHSALQLVYDPGGTLGDLTARYRPWEGGICLDALAVYLTGLEPDARAGRVALAPRLPNNWPRMAWNGLRVGDSRFDLLVEELGGLRRVTVTPTTPGTLEVQLSLPLPAATLDRVALGGDRLADDAYELYSPFGRTRVVLPKRTCDPAHPLQAEIRYRPQPP